MARVVLSVVLVVGIGISVYLARHHENQLYGDPSVELGNCPQNQTINCEVVNTSAWSELFGVPIAAFAAPTYLLLLVLLRRGKRSPEMLSYAFSIGLLTAAYSVLLFYVSSTKIGFLCLWCMRLYAINASIVVLTPIAARRSPWTLLRQTFRDLRTWPHALRFTATVFGVLLVATIAAQQGYRAVLRREAAAERARIESEGGPTIPAVPEEPPPR